MKITTYGIKVLWESGLRYCSVSLDGERVASAEFHDANCELVIRYRDEHCDIPNRICDFDAVPPQGVGHIHNAICRAAENCMGVSAASCRTA